MRALDKKLLRNLWQIRGQALAIALIVAAAVATLVLSSGTYRSLERTRAAYYTENRFADLFGSVKRAPDHTLRQIQALPGVVQVQSGIRQYALLDMQAVLEPVRAFIVSLPPEKSGLNLPVLRAGSWPRPGERDQVVVHEAFAQGHDLHPGDRLETTINGKRRTLIVSGIALSPEFVYALGPGDLVPDNRRFGIFWMDRAALAGIANLKGAFNDIAIKLDPSVNARDVIKAVDLILARYGGTGLSLRKDQISDSFINSELQQLKTMTRVIPPIFLIAAAFLLNIAIGRLVETERGQIGLLKAMGYADPSIGFHYLKTALVITGIGILIGWATGLWMGQGMTRLYIEYFRFPMLEYQITPGVFFGAAGASLAAAMLGAVLAIRRAVTIPPAVAMTPPPPPVYHLGPLERTGLFRGLTPPGRMVVRHIVRWPLRSGLTILGISMSIALILMTANFFNAIDTMLDSFFSRNNRQDVTIRFTEIRSDTVAREIARIPGVMDIELQRNVPARLVFGHLERRVAIQGLEPDARLNRPLDLNGKNIFLPESGIVLNERLAAHLKIRQGDHLEIQVLEGRMPVLHVPVTSLSREYIGLSAYISRPALNRLLREGPMADTAVISIDENRQKEFYAEMKARPGIASVFSQRAAKALFQKMVEENIFVIVSFYVLFAGALAFGVIYNNARLILTERSREFSLLRVLGFHQGEVARIFGGEIALLVFFSLLPGCVLGYGLIFLLMSAMSSDLYRAPFIISPSIFGEAVIAILIAATLSCFFVLYKLRELNLLSVLKERE